MRRRLDYPNDMDWAALLDASPDEKRPIVLIAPSMTGKSTEMRQEATRRAGRGELAIFAEATTIVDGVAQSLSADDSRVFDAWTQETRRLLFFIDAVDELYLRRRSVSDLLRRLEREIAPESRPVRLVLSARNGSWTTAESRALKSLVGNKEDVDVRLVTFESIDDVALRKLAQAEGVQDVDKFVAAIDADEIDDLIDLRPSDVALLALHWRATGVFGPWSQVLADFARQSFTESRPEMAVSRTLPPMDGYRGLLRMAAATTLMKSIHVTSPMTAAMEGAVSARRLFNDWSLDRLRELFENPLLVHKGANAEAVQLPQGLISYYLAAQWLIERVRSGMSVTTLAKALMVRVFDDNKRMVPESLRPVIGWVASEVPGLRSELLVDYPELVLFEGDPDRLADAEIVEALRATCRQIVDRRRVRGWPTRATIRKLARPSLEPQVAALLQLHEKDDLAVELLLRFVEFGRYRSCSASALQMALNVAASPRVRALAIGAVSSAGDPSNQSSLLSLLDSSDEGIRVALVYALLPDLLKGDCLVRFLAGGGDAFFADAVKTVGAGISVSDLDAALLMLSKPLATNTASDETKSAFEVGVALICLRVAKGGVLSEQALDVMEAIERFQWYASFWISRVDRQSVDLYLRGDAEARRRLWLRRFAAAEGDRVRSVMGPIYGDATSADIPWLYELAGTNPFAMDLLRRLSSEVPSPPSPPEPPPATEVHDEVHERLAALARERAAMQEVVRSQTIERQKAEAQERADLEKDIEARRPGIESGEDGNALMWAWDHLHNGGSDDRLDPVRLRSKVSDNYVDLFLKGIRASWRRHDVGPPRMDSRIVVMAMVGLAGLALDVRAGLDLSSISESDATRAARYAMHALNKLPFWFADLFRAHTDAVRKVLQEAIDAEWTHPNEHHGVLRLASSSSAEVTLAVRKIVLDLLARGAPAHLRTTQYAIDVLLTSSSDATGVAAIARRELAKAGTDAKAAEQWLRPWVHVEPIEAADWFAAHTDAVGREQFLETAARVEQDLDGSAPRAEGSRLMSPAALRVWIRLLFRFAPPSEDLQHAGAHRMGARDFVQRLRERCLARLADMVTREAHDVLNGLIDDPLMRKHDEMLRRLAERQVAAGAEAGRPSWTEEDIVRVEQQDEKMPRSLQELCTLVRSHLDDVARLVMNDDFSYRGLFTKTTYEREIQLWVASCLRERARGLYSVVRENVVDDDKEVDISAFAPGVGSIPIEIKPLGSYSAEQLVMVARQQLLGQYMQPPDRSYGILLLVRRDKVAWHIKNRNVDFGVLLGHLREEVEILRRDTDKTIYLESIDLLPPVARGAEHTPKGSRTNNAARGVKRRIAAPSKSKPRRRAGRR
jgi:hypothetical protein